MPNNKRYIVFAYNSQGSCGGWKDVAGFASNNGEIEKLVSDSMRNALILPDTIEVFDIDGDEVLRTLLLNSNGDWEQQP